MSEKPTATATATATAPNDTSDGVDALVRAWLQKLLAHGERGSRPDQQRLAPVASGKDTGVTLYR